MSRVPLVARLALAAVLAAPWLSPRPVRADNGLSSRSIPELRAAIMERNDIVAAERFLADGQAQDAVKAADPAFYLKAFARAAELEDLKGLLTGETSVRSIRLGLTRRLGCAFCLDPVKFSAWAETIPELDPATLPSLEEAMWGWNYLNDSQRAWAASKGKSDGWAKMSFPDRQETMREWALAEREALMTLNPADADGAMAFNSRAYGVSVVLGSNEMTEVWRRAEMIDQAAQGLARARANAAMSAGPGQAALLAQAVVAPTPEARLAALARFFENAGERPAALLAAAPPRPDQEFDDRSREVVGAMLKTAVLRETEGTFAGDDLKEFYSRVPLTVALKKTGMSAIGWYTPGGDTLYVNERYVEEYVKTAGASVNDLVTKPELLQNLARVFASTFVHEAQHHRQDVWARENKQPRVHFQGKEVEAFQTESLFVMQKLRADPKFRAWALEAEKTNDLVRSDMANARRMESEGPAYFERVIPNSHYPELLSGEGHAWCSILYHNEILAPLQAEADRRARLSNSQKRRLARSTRALKENYETQEAFLADLRLASNSELRKNLKEAKQALDDDPKLYNLLRARQDEVSAVTMSRYLSLDAPPETSRTERAFPGVPSPILSSTENR